MFSFNRFSQQIKMEKWNWWLKLTWCQFPLISETWWIPSVSTVIREVLLWSLKSFSFDCHVHVDTCKYKYRRRNILTDKDRVPSSQSSDAPEPDPHQFAEARIDIRKFAQFLTGQQVNPTKVICSKYICGDNYLLSLTQKSTVT